MDNFITVGVINNSSEIPSKNNSWNRALREIIEKEHIRVILPISGVRHSDARVAVHSSLVSIVEDEHYLNPKEGEVPLIVGSQFGINWEYINGWRQQGCRILTVGVSLLSGNVSGVRWMN